MNVLPLSLSLSLSLFVDVVLSRRPADRRYVSCMDMVTTNMMVHRLTASLDDAKENFGDRDQNFRRTSFYRKVRSSTNYSYV